MITNEQKENFISTYVEINKRIPYITELKAKYENLKPCGYDYIDDEWFYNIETNKFESKTITYGCCGDPDDENYYEISWEELFDSDIENNLIKKHEALVKEEQKRIAKEKQKEELEKKKKIKEKEKNEYNLYLKLKEKYN